MFCFFLYIFNYVGPLFFPKHLTTTKIHFILNTPIVLCQFLLFFCAKLLVEKIMYNWILRVIIWSQMQTDTNRKKMLNTFVEINNICKNTLMACFNCTHEALDLTLVLFVLHIVHKHTHRYYTVDRLYCFKILC